MVFLLSCHRCLLLAHCYYCIDLYCYFIAFYCHFIVSDCYFIDVIVILLNFSREFIYSYPYFNDFDHFLLIAMHTQSVGESHRRCQQVMACRAKNHFGKVQTMTSSHEIHAGAQLDDLSLVSSQSKTSEEKVMRSRLHVNDVHLRCYVV